MLYLDHVIWTGNNIAESSAKYGMDFAVKSVKGGEHEEWGTFNFLTHLSNNCYLEWLGVNNMKLAKRLDHPLIEQLIYTLEHEQHGPFQFALRTDKLDHYIAHFRENNIPFHGPFKGQRRKPNGTLLSWRMLFPTCDFTHGEVLPFLIEWDQPESERIDVSLINHQAISAIHFGGATKEVFTHLYDLPNKKLSGNKVNLGNTKIHFSDNKELRIDLI